MNEIEEWNSNLQRLFSDDDTVDLILLLDKLTSDTIKQWQSTKGNTGEQVTEIRDKQLLPNIIQLGWICLEALRFHNLIIYQEGLERLTRIYDLGRFKVLGLVNRESHLWWTEPTKGALTQLYVIGSYATLRKRTDAIKTLLDCQARANYSRSYSPILSHPLFESHSGESTLDYFNGALSQMTNEPSLFDLYVDDKNTIVESLCQFDLIVAYSLWRQGIRRSPNFVRYSKSQTNPVIELIIRQDFASAIFGSFDPDQFAKFLQVMNSQANYLSGRQWVVDDWTEPISEFLKQYPAREGAR